MTEIEKRTGQRLTPEKCPYDDCPFEGTEGEVDDHVSYMTSTMLNDPDHAPARLIAQRLLPSVRERPSGH